MYPSDHGYATIGGTNMNRASCLAKELNNWNDASDCYNNDWFYEAGTYQWTISLSTDSIVANAVFSVLENGCVSIPLAISATTMRATFMLQFVFLFT